MISDLLAPAADQVPVTVVRVRTSKYATSRGLAIRKEISYVRRKSRLHNILEEDASMVGADDVIDKIKNLDSVPDGLYRVATCDEHRDWETGYVDEYNYVLLPYTKQKCSEGSSSIGG